LSYSAEITRRNPACIVFLLDRSESMAGVLVDDQIVRKADFIGELVNETLQQLVIRCSKTEEVTNDYYVSAIGYGDSAEPVFDGWLSGRSVVPISEVAEHPAGVEMCIRGIPDGAGGLVERRVCSPAWIRLRPRGGRSMCEAFRLVRDTLEGWLSAHRTGFPPIVLHISGGESSDGDPTRFGKNITTLSTDDGPVLFFNCYLSFHRNDPTIEYPADDSNLPDEFARMLLNISSRLPNRFCEAAMRTGLNMAKGARGFVFNAYSAEVLRFLNIGAHPTTLHDPQARARSKPHAPLHRGQRRS